MLYCYVCLPPSLVLQHFFAILVRPPFHPTKFECDESTTHEFRSAAAEESGDEEDGGDGNDQDGRDPNT